MRLASASSTGSTVTHAHSRPQVKKALLTEAKLRAENKDLREQVKRLEVQLQVTLFTCSRRSLSLCVIVCPSVDQVAVQWGGIEDANLVATLTVARDAYRDEAAQAAAALVQAQEEVADLEGQLSEVLQWCRPCVPLFDMCALPFFPLGHRTAPRRGHKALRRARAGN